MWLDNKKPLAADAPFRVGLKRGEFIDPLRSDRIVPYKLYFPQEMREGKAPLILWSHGFGGNRDGASFLSRYLAGQGYALLHLTHVGTDSSLWEGKPGHPWDILRKIEVDRETTLNRFRDIPFVLDQLPSLIKDEPDFQAIDLNRIGMSGHSFGALSTQVAAGQIIPDQKENLIRIRDERIQAGILYSPVPIGYMLEEHEATPDDIYGPIEIPLLHMTGTEDASPIGGAPYDHRLVVYEHAGHPEQYLLVKQDGDHMVYNGTRGKLDANPLREKHEEIVKVGSLAFWDAYLKDDVAARDWLQNDFEYWLSGSGRFKYQG